MKRLGVYVAGAAILILTLYSVGIVAAHSATTSECVSATRVIGALHAKYPGLDLIEAKITGATLKGFLDAEGKRTGQADLMKDVDLAITVTAKNANGFVVSLFRKGCFVAQAPIGNDTFQREMGQGA